MKEPKPKDSVKIFERLSRKDKGEAYVLRLYVTGTTPRSVHAIENIKRICNEYLDGRCDLEVIDVYQQPSLAKGEQIIAAPTLIRKLPLPIRRLIGDLSNTERILLGLDLRPRKTRKTKKQDAKVEDPRLAHKEA